MNGNLPDWSAPNGLKIPDMSQIISGYSEDTGSHRYY